MNRPRDLPPLHLVTDDGVVARSDFATVAGELLAAGGSRVALHLRAPSAPGRRLYELAGDLTRVARRTGSLLIVNDRVDVALAAESGGVQLGRRSLGIGDARRLLGPERLVGASVHEPVAARAAFAQGADFVLAGTLFRSPSHPGKPGSGVAWLEGLSPPPGNVIGIGGVRLARVREVLRTGAHGVAVLSPVWNAERPREVLLRFIDALDGMEWK